MGQIFVLSCSVASRSQSLNVNYIFKYRNRYTVIRPGQYNFCCCSVPYRDVLRAIVVYDVLTVARTQSKKYRITNARTTSESIGSLAIKILHCIRIELLAPPFWDLLIDIGHPWNSHSSMSLPCTTRKSYTKLQGAFDAEKPASFLCASGSECQFRLATTAECICQVMVNETWSLHSWRLFWSCAVNGNVFRLNFYFPHEWTQNWKPNTANWEVNFWWVREEVLANS